MSVLALLAVALGGGIVAALLGAWFERLSALEVARLLVQAELLANLAAHNSFALLGPDDDAPHVDYSTSAWVTHSARLAVRAQRYPDVWSSLISLYGVMTVIPYQTGPLEASTAERANYAVANIDALELRALELVPVYGPRRAWVIWRERRRARAAYLEAHADG